MKLYLDLELLNKGPRPSARAPKAPSAPAVSTPAKAQKPAGGSKVADVGTGEKAGAVAPTAPTANAAKKSAKPKATPTPAASPAQGASSPTPEASQQSKSGKSGGAGTQMITCPLPPDVCYQYGGSGSGKHRANSPIYQKHTQIAAKRGTAGAPAAKEPEQAAPAQQQPDQADQAQAANQEAPPGQQPAGKKARTRKKKGAATAEPAEAQTPSVQLGDKEIHGAAAASVADVPEAPPPRPEKQVPVDKPAKSKAPAGKQKKAKVAPDPAAVQMQSQHLQEYLAGSRDADHHKVIHAMTVAEHRRAAAEFRAAGSPELAKLHEQAAVAKPRLKDLSGTQAHETVPEGERPYSAHYLDAYISHSSRYLAGGPGGHPASRFGQIHSMTESQHNELAQQLESAGANSAAARHRRIAAMKKDFSTREKTMKDHKEAEAKVRAERQSKASVESAARRELKRKESFKVPNNPFQGGASEVPDTPKTHAEDISHVGSNALSHLIHNHDMPPEHKRDLLQQVLKLQDLHDRGESPTDADKTALAQLKSDLGHYGQESYTGRKALPGKRYLSRFDAHELEAHADLAEMSGMGDLASKYRDAAAAKHESANRERIKVQATAAKQQAKAQAVAAKQQATAAKQQAKAADKAKRDQQRAALQQQKAQESAERKRLAAAPHLPGDHGEYVQHAKSQGDRIHDFLNSPADLEPHEREAVENAHKIINAHSQLTSPATPEQRRELADALKVSQAHMDKAKFHQLGQGPESPTAPSYKVNTRALFHTFTSGWHQGSAIAQTAAKDQTAGNLATQLPQTVGATVVDSTNNALSEDRSKRVGNKEDGNDPRLKYADIAQTSKNPNTQGQPSNSATTSSPTATQTTQSQTTAAPTSTSTPTPAPQTQGAAPQASQSQASAPASQAQASTPASQSQAAPASQSQASTPAAASQAQASSPAASSKRPSARAKPQPKPTPVTSSPSSSQSDSNSSSSAVSPATAKKKRPSARAVKKSEAMSGLYLDLNKAVQIPNVGMDSDSAKVKKLNSGNSGGGSGFTPDRPDVGRDWHQEEEEDETSKSLLCEMQDLLRSMSENLASQLRTDSNSVTEMEFLLTQGYSLPDAKYNTNLLSKGFLRKKYDSWLLTRMEKSLSSLWSNK